MPGGEPRREQRGQPPTITTPPPPGVHGGFSVVPRRTGLKWLKRPARAEVRAFHKWLPTQDVEESA